MFISLQVLHSKNVRLYIFYMAAKLNYRYQNLQAMNTIRGKPVKYFLTLIKC